MTSIGIFWVYKNTVFGKKSSIAEGEEAIRGLVDSPYNHVDFWDSETEYRRLFPELAHLEYQQVPRGRVLYQAAKDAPLVYLDSALNTEPCRSLIAEFFGFEAAQGSWRNDLHYTTRQRDLDALFDDE